MRATGLHACLHVTGDDPVSGVATNPCTRG